MKTRGVSRAGLAALLATLVPLTAASADDEVPATRLADTVTQPYTFGGSRPREMTRVGDLVFFAAGTRLTGRELFVTDGTEVGTRLVTELVPGAAGSGPRQLIEKDGLLFFMAETAARGLAPWRSDGTAAGTVPADAMPEPPPPPELIPGTDDVRHLLFFSEEHPEVGFELYRTDGTVDGTYLVKDIYPGAESGVPGQFTRVGDEVFFSARTPEHGVELWKTDGTTAGTVLVKDVRPGPEWGATRHLANLDDRLLLFSGWDAEHGTELWRSDGTEDGTVFIADLAPAEHQSGDPHDIRDMGDGTAYFAAATDRAFIELWRTDGTAEGTYLVRDIEPDRADAHIADVVRVDDGVLFSAGIDPGRANRLQWATDGTAARTLPRTDSTGVIVPLELGLGSSSVHGTVAFRGDAVGFLPDRSLYFFGGAWGPGTLLIPPVTSPSTNVWGTLIPFGERLLFQIDAGSFPSFTRELWVTDGTADGSSFVGVTGRAGDIEDDRVFLGDSAYLAFGRDGIQRTDGTLEGTFWIPAVDDRSIDDVSSLAVAGERVLMVADNETSGAHNVLAYTPADFSLVALDTVAVRQLVSARSDLERSLWGVGRTALFVHDTRDELWKTDGTPLGTAHVADVVPGWGGGEAASDVEPVRVGSRVLFAALTAEHGQELWCVTDGEPGARLVADIAPGPADSRPNGLLPLGSSDHAVFAAADGEHGMELWITDGTPAGTHLLSDLRPGTESSNPRELTQTETELFLVADADEAGEEPWAVSLAGLGLPASAFDGSDGAVTGGEPVGTAPESVVLDRVRVKLDFRRSGRDRVTLRGKVPVPDDVDTEGMRVVVRVAAASQVFTLNGKGRTKRGKSRFRLRSPKAGQTDARFETTISGDLRGAFSGDGLTADKGPVPTEVTLVVSLLVDDVTRTRDVEATYRVKRRRGKAREAAD